MDDKLCWNNEILIIQKGRWWNGVMSMTHWDSNSINSFWFRIYFFLFIWVKQTTINLINKTVLKGFSVSDNIPSVSSIDVNSLCRSVPIVVTWLVCLPDLDCLNTRSEDITYLFKIYKGKTMNNRWRKWSIHTNVTGNLNQIVKTSQTRRNH